MKSTRIAAHVYLKSVSGRSITELATGLPPDDLTPFLPPPSARSEVTRWFNDRGFEVHADDLGIALSIDGTPTLFERAFRTDQAKLATDVGAEVERRLPIPEELSGLVDAIAIIPPPELLA